MLRNPLREYVDRTVIVNTRDGSERAFRGTLVCAHRAVLVLSDCYLIEPQQTPLGGTIILERSNVAWLQVM